MTTNTTKGCCQKCYNERYLLNTNAGMCLNLSCQCHTLDNEKDTTSDPTGAPKQEDSWKIALSKAGVWVEGISSNGETLLIKVKDIGGAFEYGIYNQARLEEVIHTEIIKSQLEVLDEIGTKARKECEEDEINDIFRGYNKGIRTVLRIIQFKRHRLTTSKEE